MIVSEPLIPKRTKRLSPGVYEPYREAVIDHRDRQAPWRPKRVGQEFDLFVRCVGSVGHFDMLLNGADLGRHYKAHFCKLLRLRRLQNSPIFHFLAYWM